MTDVARFATAELAARRTAQDLADAAAAARDERGAAHLCLTGGTSPLRVYELLGPLLPDWDGVHLWYSDERCVPYDRPDSNHGAAAARLVAPGATWHPMPTAAGPSAGAQAYARELGDTIIDLNFLGMGPDGHIASLFPHHRLLEATAAVCGIDDSPKPPPERITLTLPAINASREILLLVTGEAKAPALARALGDPDRGTPASLLDRERLVVVADEEALRDA